LVTVYMTPSPKLRRSESPRAFSLRTTTTELALAGRNATPLRGLNHARAVSDRPAWLCIIRDAVEDSIR
jgi:hypothetical protein